MPLKIERGHNLLLHALLLYEATSTSPNFASFSPQHLSGHHYLTKVNINMNERQ